MTGLHGDGVRLPLVLGETSVDRLDDIRADGGLEDGGEGGGSTAGLAIGTDNRDSRTGRLYGKNDKISISSSNRELHRVVPFGT